VIAAVLPRKAQFSITARIFERQGHRCRPTPADRRGWGLDSEQGHQHLWTTTRQPRSAQPPRGVQAMHPETHEPDRTDDSNNNSLSM